MGYQQCYSNTLYIDFLIKCMSERSPIIHALIVAQGAWTCTSLFPQNFSYSLLSPVASCRWRDRGDRITL
jgi:hypothetical protein